ncbi:MAG: extracellular solute-binding protein [Lachnospiraceae bacterium]|nr:extracellular solute-binding protein [Lachnospiraceae bacterium]
MRSMLKKIPAILLAGTVLFSAFLTDSIKAFAKTDDKVITLRVCNWEEYMDLGDWDEEETIDLESGDIYGERPLYEEFEDWYFENYGVKVKVEYSCFGTNEELYNMLTLGDVYDLVCPSEYMVMKLMAEDAVVPYSQNFFDERNALNYYIRNLSPFIRKTLTENKIGGRTWASCMASYMWGITGILYNPEEVTREEASTWDILTNPKFFRQVTIKDNVRDAYFPAVAVLKGDLLTSEVFTSFADYHERLAAEMNDTSQETIDAVQEYLQKVKNNAYSFETDSGKSDMITGKVLANLQWSGDAVYAMDQAEEDDFILEYVAPKECTNLWFDGWVMLKSGVEGDPEKQQVAEAFVNFLSMPENAVRNMYYIGYSSAISGGADGDQVFEYLEWNYSADEDEEEVVDYDVSFFFDPEDTEGNFVLETSKEQTRRQLYGQYPPRDVLERSAVMQYFDTETNTAINHMWIRVRCFNIGTVPFWAWIIVSCGIASLIVFLILAHRKSK